LKKMTGPNSIAYEVIDRSTGEIIERPPEYTTMSRRPGIAQAWLEKYWTDIYPGDFVVIDNVKMKPPKYYDQQMEKHQPEIYEQIKLSMNG